MGPKLFVKPTITPTLTLPSLSPSFSFSSRRHQFHTFRSFLPVLCSKPISKHLPNSNSNGFATVPLPVNSEGLEPIRNITVGSLGLQPLCPELYGFSSERLISAEALQRNRVMQKSYGNQFVSKQFLVHKNWVQPILTRGRLACTGSRFLSHHGNSNPPILVTANEEELEVDKVHILKQKMELLGINCDGFCVPGKFSHLLCPKCNGGKSLERSLSLHIIQDADFAMWRCYRTSCGWSGQTFADNRVTKEGMNMIFKVKSSGPMTSEGITLEPLGEKLIAYFSDRRISEETLQRNHVMQMAGDQDTIAFTYRQNGELVGCKFRTIEKKFWQDKGTAKWLYGLDDIYEATEIIIVEGEIDKLSMEEAGFCNCVSVPGGAPQVVSSKDLPPLENDKAYQYLWNCKNYLDKVSRIILATDSDVAGQALAEELARRLGKERCWVVRWPKKDHSRCFKDANEVLKCLGPIALKEIVENAKLYHSHILNPVT